MKIVKADFTDIEDVSKLYDDVCDYLYEHINYPGWGKSEYPTKDDAEKAVKEGTLYIAKDNQKILGSVILRHKPEDGYKNVKWLSENNYEKIYVIYTLAVHPDSTRLGIGKKIIGFCRRGC
ncbi:MAG: GNAT family N-acetyltransferase [Traorella sp.]